MKRSIIFLLLLVISHQFLFSQKEVKVTEIMYLDEEMGLFYDTAGTIVYFNEGFLKYEYMYLLFDIKMRKSLQYDASSENVMCFKILSEISGDTIPMKSCGLNETSGNYICFHTYCSLRDNMIKGGRQFRMKDIYNNFKGLQKQLQRTIKVLYFNEKKNSFVKIKIPKIKIISPSLPEKMKFEIRHKFCPFTENDNIWRDQGKE